MTPVSALRSDVQALLEHGSVHASPGGQYSFRVIGPCCRLFDREELPWPCCRLAWRSKEPSWRRVGADLCQIWLPGVAPHIRLSCSSRALALHLRLLTLFSMRLTPELQEWWYSRLPKSMVALNHSAFGVIC